MQGEDAAPLMPADLDDVLQLVGEMAAAQEALHRTIDVLVDLTRMVVATQSELLATVEELHEEHAPPRQDEKAPQLDDAPSPDEHLGTRRQAKQYHAHSAALVQRAKRLADRARTLQTDAAELLEAADESRRATARGW